MLVHPLIAALAAYPHHRIEPPVTLVRVLFACACLKQASAGKTDGGMADGPQGGGPQGGGSNPLSDGAPGDSDGAEPLPAPPASPLPPSPPAPSPPPSLPLGMPKWPPPPPLVPPSPSPPAPSPPSPSPGQGGGLQAGPTPGGHPQDDCDGPNGECQASDLLTTTCDATVDERICKLLQNSTPAFGPNVSDALYFSTTARRAQIAARVALLAPRCHAEYAAAPLDRCRHIRRPWSRSRRWLRSADTRRPLCKQRTAHRSRTGTRTWSTALATSSA